LFEQISITFSEATSDIECGAFTYTLLQDGVEVADTFTIDATNPNAPSVEGQPIEQTWVG
jgi:hypothetical protein